MNMIGNTISHYRILEKLGEGGMGVVYKAQDLKLDRFAALKILSPHLTATEENKKRFANEAKAVSALDHPNICTLYELGDTEDGQMFISMAYYEGETIRHKIKNQPLPVGMALDVAIKTAQGLRKAHEKGIVHRDIKTDNIMITEDGETKVMDFGLASIVGASTLTRVGGTVGTMPYMSPEQARGEKVDHRSDIWSLGVVIYEMVTGQLPFKSEYNEALVYSILNEEPHPMTALRSGVPMDLERIVRKAMHKNTGERYQSVSDMAVDLRQLQKTPAESALEHHWFPKKPFLSFGRSIRIGSILILSIAAIIYTITQYMRSPLPFSSRQITFAGKSFRPVISPDGQFVAYEERSREDPSKTKLLIQDLASVAPAVSILDLKSILDLAWSADGTQLLVAGSSDKEGWATWLLSRIGGPPKRTVQAARVSWAPDKAKFAAIHVRVPGWNSIWIVNLSVGNFDTLYVNVGNHLLSGVDWSPSGNRLLFLSQDIEDARDRLGKNTLWTIGIDGEHQQKICDDVVAARWSPTGESIYCFVADTLYKIEVGKVKGSRRFILTFPHFGGFFSVTKDEKRLWTTSDYVSSEMYLHNVGSKKAASVSLKEQITADLHDAVQPRIDPRKEYVALIDDGIAFRISITERQKEQLAPLRDCYGLAWSPDSQRIVIGATTDGVSKLYLYGYQGIQALREASVGEIAWFPGERVLYSGKDFGHEFLDIRTGRQEPFPALDRYWPLWNVRYSSDGQSVAFRSSKRGAYGLWTLSLLDSTARRWSSDNSTYPIRWSADNQGIYVLTTGEPSQIQFLRRNESTPQSMFVFPLRMNNPDAVDITPDGKSVVYILSELYSNLWVVENFDPDAR
ncbi:MAG TPA: protein kinase [Bacteroidota bacterium]|nr:protein kinase [Bacteroidota bacterium]